MKRGIGHEIPGLVIEQLLATEEEEVFIMKIAPEKSITLHWKATRISIFERDN